ncbi:MAG TPA: glycosyltransferase family 4 protein [Actinophytocola sp.]|nr:glycosyltransferase family 4 protein [Actinophytocola sp.]
MNHVFGELSRRATLVDVYQPEPSLAARTWSRMSTLSPSAETRRRSYKRHAPLFQAKSRRCRTEVDRRRHGIDVILQWEFFFAPTDRFPSTVPYCVYNDWTTALTERQYPHWLLPRIRAGTHRVQGALLRNAEYVFTFTELARRSVIEDYGVAPERAVTAWAGANLPALPENLVRPSTVDDPMVLLVGNDYHGKGVDVLVAAMRLVRQRIPGARAVVAGGSGQYPAVPGVEVRPNQDKDALDRLFRQASVFALPTRADAFGHAFAEAMAYRLPCVGTDTGGVPEVIDDGRTGFLVPVNDVEALAARIVTLLEQPDLATRFGVAGRERMEERFTWPRVVDRMVPYLERAAAR